VSVFDFYSAACLAAAGPADSAACLAAFVPAAVAPAAVPVVAVAFVVDEALESSALGLQAFQ
jgi:hypothetical protein